MKYICSNREIYFCWSGKGKCTVRDTGSQKILTGAIKSLKDKDFKLQVGNIKVIRDWGYAEEYVEGIQAITRATILKDQIICTGIETSLESFINMLLTSTISNHPEFNGNYAKWNDMDPNCDKFNKVRIWPTMVCRVAVLAQ